MADKSRGIILANSWRKKQLKILLQVKEEMIGNNISNKDIDEYINTEYNNIEIKYNQRIEKQKNNNSDKIKKIKSKQRKEIKVLIQSKLFLEDNRINIDDIDLFNQKYQEINEEYKQKAKILNIKKDKIDFID